VELMQQRVWRLRQRHLGVRLKNQDSEGGSKVAQRPQAKPELARKPAVLKVARESPAKEALGLVSR